MLDDFHIIRSHRNIIATRGLLLYRRTSVVCLSVGLSVTTVSAAKAAEPIVMLFGVLTRVGESSVYD